MNLGSHDFKSDSKAASSPPSAERRPTVAIIGTRGYPSYYGGFETAVRKLAPYLADQGWDVVVYGRDGTTREEDPHRDHRVESVVSKGYETKSLSTMSYGYFAAKDAARRRPDVALVMNVANGFVLPLLKARGIPTLVNVDGIEWERAKWGRAAKMVFRLGAKATAKFGTRLVFDSKEIGRRWEVGFDRRGDFIPYGGDERESLPLKDNLISGKYVLYVARFVPENSIHEFIGAAQRLAKNIDVVVVGSSGYGGEIDDKMQTVAEREDRVHWLGHVSDDDRLHALWQHAGVYFHGHTVGGTNPALVQAMALGVPTVAVGTVYNREVLGGAGEFVGRDPDRIAHKISEVLADDSKRQEMSRRGLERARETYSWSLVNAAYERALSELREQAGSIRAPHVNEGHTNGY